MAKVILNSRYIKYPARVNAGRIVKYMGTREGVEKVAKGIDNSPATKRQQALIDTVTKHYKESITFPEFKTYFYEQTKHNATVFLDAVVERYADRTDELKTLVSYIAERPSVEKIGTHGLFSSTDEKIDLEKVAEKVSNHNGYVFTHVLSLKREDAERLGYNSAEAWKELVRRHQIELAYAHKINPDDLEWYGAFHNKEHHPHIHLVVYSKTGTGYLTAKGIRELKSSFSQDIFRNDQYKLYAEQTRIRNELKDEMQKVLEELKTFKPKEFVISDATADLMRKLKSELKTVEGKKKYGYLPKRIKNIVDDLLKQIVNENPDLKDMYSKWNEVNRQKLSVYRDASKESDIPIEENKEFKSLKNMLIEAVSKMIIIGNSKTVMNNRINKSLCVDFITAAALLLSSKTAKRINELTAQSRSLKDSKALEKERQKRLAHGDKSVDSGYDKEEKDEYTSEVAADNIAALLEIFELITRGNADVKREEERLRVWYQEYQRQQAQSYDEDEDEDYDKDYEEEDDMTFSM